MQIFNKNGKIYIKFHSSSKIIQKSLKLAYNEKNLKFVKTTLIPIFCKLSGTKQTQNSKPNLKPKFNHQNAKKQTLKKPKLLSYYCHELYSHLCVKSKISTIKTAQSSIKRFFDFIEDKTVQKYTIYDIQSAIIAMQKANLSPATIRTILAYPQSAFNNALKDNLILKNPISISQKPSNLKQEHQIFTKSQIEKLLFHATGELKIFLYIAFYTGARSGEILALKGKNFDFKNNLIHITHNQTRFELTTPKNGKSRTIYLLPKLKKFLQDLNLGENEIFSKDYFAINYTFRKLLRTLNFTPCGLHTTRHTFCSVLLQNKISPTLIAKMLGHSNLDMINRVYAHFVADPNDINELDKAMKL